MRLYIRPCNDLAEESVRGRQRLGFLQLHLFAAATDGTLAGLGAEHLGAAGPTLKPFSKLVCHIISPSSAKRRLFLLFHGLAAACDLAVAALGHNKLGSALGADIFFTYLISHWLITSSSNFMLKTGWLQTA